MLVRLRQCESRSSSWLRSRGLRPTLDAVERKRLFVRRGLRVEIWIDAAGLCGARPRRNGPWQTADQQHQADTDREAKAGGGVGMGRRRHVPR